METLDYVIPHYRQGPFQRRHYIMSTSTALSMTSLTWPMSLLLTRGPLVTCTMYPSLYMLISTQNCDPKLLPNPIMNEGLKVRFQLILKSMLHVMLTVLL